MNIFSFFTLFGGLAFFLYGMNVMSSGLEKLSGGKLEKMLKSLTSNPFKALALGAGITIAIQSSSALTVMLVGLVNSGIMNLNQTIGIIMGSNVGTTLTAWILSLSGIDTFIIQIYLLPFYSFRHILHDSHISFSDHIPTGLKSRPFLPRLHRIKQPVVYNNLEIRYRRYR